MTRSCPWRLTGVVALGVLVHWALCTLARADGDGYGSHGGERVSAESSDGDYGHSRIQRLARRYEVIDLDTGMHRHHRVRRRSMEQVHHYLHPDATNFTFSAFGQLFQLQLQLNTVLFPKGHGVELANTGKVDRTTVNCYYQGHLVGQDIDGRTSYAAVSACHGISGVLGLGRAGQWGDETFFIEPVSPEPSTNGSHMHAIYRADDARTALRNLTCGSNPVHMAAEVMTASLGAWTNGAAKDGQVKPGRHRLRRQTSKETKYMYIELMLVIDSRLYHQTLKRNRSMARERASSVANFVDMVYQPLGIRVPLVYVLIWDGGDESRVARRPQKTLRNFIDYRSQNLDKWVRHDTAQLLTGIDFKGNTIGVASIRGMCMASKSAGVNQDTESSYNIVASTVAHEMGHLLGMEHDNASICQCSEVARDHLCIMASLATSFITTKWSSCSKRYLHDFLSQGGGHCLSNEPLRLFDEPECGDRYVEGDEECDCGTEHECADRCCNASTCRLAVHAGCSSGACCEDCQLMPAGTMCRPAVNRCDIEETCNGVMNTCPTDIFLQNGQPCSLDSPPLMCYDGMCQSHDSQCQQVWGPTSHSAPEVCYASNALGNPSSNCGYDPEMGNRPCAPADIMCGRLWCLGGTLETRNIFRNKIMGLECKAYSSTTDDSRDLGYVVDGVKCGNESICVAHQCKKYSSIGVAPCPSSNERVCSGNGVCTNLNTCRCFSGWSGESCASASDGPENGGWSPWSEWSICSESCGISGESIRMRSCDSPPPSAGGAYCKGRKREMAPCGRSPCPSPIHGAWSAWSTSWTACGATCSHQSGTRVRVRTCNNPMPARGGWNCAGSSIQSESCSSTRQCPLPAHGEPCWLPWQSWTSCSMTCGGGYGIQVRQRACGCASCEGSYVDQMPCGEVMCQPLHAGQGGNLTEWSSWETHGNCFSCARDSYRVRRRSCSGRIKEPMSCNASLVEKQPCPPCKESGLSSKNITLASVFGVAFGLLIVASIAVVVCILHRQGVRKTFRLRVRVEPSNSPPESSQADVPLGSMPDSGRPAERASPSSTKYLQAISDPCRVDTISPELFSSHSTENLLSGLSSNEHSPVPPHVAASTHKQSSRQHASSRTPAIIASIQLRDAVAPNSHRKSRADRAAVPAVNLRIPVSSSSIDGCKVTLQARATPSSELKPAVPPRPVLPVAPTVTP